MRTMASLRKDFIGGHLRSQINTLKGVLTTIETENSIDDGYIDANLRRVEKNLQGLRKLNKN